MAAPNTRGLPATTQASLGDAFEITHYYLNNSNAALPDKVACGRVVRSVDHNIVVSNQVYCIGWRQALGVCIHLHIAVDAPACVCCGQRFVATHVSFTVEHLAMQVAAVNSVAVNDAQTPDACCSEVLCNRAAQATCAYNEDGASLQGGLSWVVLVCVTSSLLRLQRTVNTKGREDDLSTVSLDEMRWKVVAFMLVRCGRQIGRVPADSRAIVADVVLR